MDEIAILQAEVLKTLASPRRLAILRRLADGSRGMGEPAGAATVIGMMSEDSVPLFI